MSKAAKKAPPRKKGTNGYKMPDPIPKGEILTDMKKQKWIISTSIGVGGFGEIYAAAQYKDKTPSEYPAVIKIEPHGNGPLFVEMHFYMRNAKPTDIADWKKENKLSFIGMPPFLGSGSHECNGTKYRFIVMERYGTDLWKLFLENERRFPEHTVYKVAWQIINVLEYIHSKTYVHADIKGANLLLHLKSPNQVYLVDFGLASHYTTKDDYKLDPKKAHNGTIEYTSRDAHMGVPTMRGDFEILIYNMIQWLCGALPWETNLKDPSFVQTQKENAFIDIPKFLKKCFNTSAIPAPVSQFMTLLASLKFNETPSYNKFRDILVKGLKNLGHTTTGNLDFSEKSTSKSVKTTKKTIPSIVEERSPAKKSRATPKAKSPKTTPVVKTPRGKQAVPVVSKSLTPEANSSKTTPAVKSPRGKRTSQVLNETLNSSFDSIVLDERCMSGKDMRKQLLANIDGDAEYTVQIKKRKTRMNSNSTPNRTPSKSPPKRGRKKVQKLDSTLSDSEVEVISRGTRSRPGSKSVPNNKKTIKRISDKLKYDSDKDMFESSVDD